MVVVMNWWTPIRIVVNSWSEIVGGLEGRFDPGTVQADEENVHDQMTIIDEMENGLSNQIVRPKE